MVPDVAVTVPSTVLHVQLIVIWMDIRVLHVWPENMDPNALTIVLATVQRAQWMEQYVFGVNRAHMETIVKTTVTDSVPHVRDTVLILDFHVLPVKLGIMENDVHQTVIQQWPSMES